jgi:hypothetical protein
VRALRGAREDRELLRGLMLEVYHFSLILYMAFVIRHYFLGGLL